MLYTRKDEPFSDREKKTKKKNSRDATVFDRSPGHTTLLLTIKRFMEQRTLLP